MGEDKTTMDNVNQLHDKVFKVSLRHMAVAKDILKFNLSPSALKELSLADLTLYNNDLVDEKLKPLFADLIYVSKSAKGPEDDHYLIVEHQSYPDKLLPVRLLTYQTALIHQHFKQYPNVTRIPLVLSKIFYQGQENYAPYPANLSLLNLFNYETFGKHLRRTKLDFTDLNLVSDRVLQEHRFASLLEFVLKHNKVLELLEIFPVLEKIVIQTHELMLKEREDLLDSYITLAIQYLLAKGHTQYPGQVIARVRALPSVGEQIMGTVAEKLQEEGLQKGLEKGREEGALTEATKIIVNLLQRQFSLTDISQITGRPLADIKRLIANYK